MSTPAELAGGKRRWFLARRVTFWSALFTSLLGLLFFGLGLWAVHTSVEAQIRALGREEIEEVTLGFPATGGTPEEFEALAQTLAAKHPKNPMVWFLWRTASGELVRAVGPPGVRRPANLQLVPGFKRYEHGMCWTGTSMTGDYSVGLLVDGSSLLELRDRYLFVAILLLLVSVLAAVFGSAWLGRWVAGFLHQATEGVRAAQHTPPDAVDAGPDAPEEIRQVVLALHETLHSVRREVERSRVLTSGLAHELRSPIQNLLGEAEVALLRERSSGEYRRLLESQLEELRDLARAIDNLVTLCAEGETRRSAGRERFDLGAELPLRLGREQALAARRNVDMQVAGNGALPLEGDREALLLAVRNVVTNAIDWSGDGGTVRVQLAGSNGSLEILVDDSGPGVPAEEREFIFNPFHQGPAPPRRRSGFGLGLALAHTAVVAHGGTIEVGSSPLGGARFRIVLQSAAREP